MSFLEVLHIEYCKIETRSLPKVIIICKYNIYWASILNYFKNFSKNQN